MSIRKEYFGTTKAGEEVSLYSLSNRNGMCLKVMDFGGRMVQLYVPDKNGVPADIIMGFDSLEPYTIKNPYFGAIVGRCANRISNSEFTLNGKVYSLDKNAAPHHLHGGTVGFDKRVWQAEMVEKEKEDQLVLTLDSADGDQGYPGNLHVTVCYTLTDQNEVSLTYEAVCDKDTVVNMTNHNYFNLSGHNSGTIAGQKIWIDADSFTPTDAEHIPYGTTCSVDGTPMDLRQMKEIGVGMESDYEQIAQNEGYDVNFVLNHFGEGMRTVCRAEDPVSGRSMEVKTDRPAMQFYTANYIKGNFVGKGGYAYPQHCGFCLETQDFPNSPNTPQFPSVVLHPGEVYHHHTIYAFDF